MTSRRRTKALRHAEAQRRSEAHKALEGRRRRARILGAAVGALVVAGVGTGIGIAVSSAGTGAPPAQDTGVPSAQNTGGTPELKLGSLASLGTLQPPGSPGPAGPEGVPIPAAPALAGTTSEATGQSVDGISCDTSEQTLFHIHAHLTIFVDGAARQLPAGIGIPGAQAQATPEGPFVSSGTCFYWLHTHAADGIIHIESPAQRTYTLGDFFDEWGESLGPEQVGPYHAKVTAFYDGEPYEGNPRDIPLHAHAQIQLDLGTPLIAPEHITFPPGL